MICCPGICHYYHRQFPSARDFQSKGNHPQHRYCWCDCDCSALSGLQCSVLYWRTDFRYGTICKRWRSVKLCSLSAVWKMGNLILGSAVVLACMTTSIGLTTSFGEYFSKMFPRFSYKSIVTVVTLFTWLISNVGLQCFWIQFCQFW